MSFALSILLQSLVFAPAWPGGPSAVKYAEMIGTPETVTQDKITRACKLNLPDKQEVERSTFEETGGRGFKAGDESEQSGVTPRQFRVNFDSSGLFDDVRFSEEISSSSAKGSSFRQSFVSNGKRMTSEDAVLMGDQGIIVSFSRTDSSQYEAVRVSKGYQLKTRVAAVGICLVERKAQQPLSEIETQEFLTQ